MVKTLLYITNGLSGSGGLERVVCLKASYFADTLGHNVHIIILNEKHQNPYYELSGKVILHNVEATGNIFRFSRQYFYGIKKFIHKIAPDVIFVADDGLKGLYIPLIFKYPAKFIYERHTTKAINGSGLKAFIINRMMDFGSRYFNRFVVLTESNRKDWKYANGLTVIPNPLPFSCKEVPSVDSREKIISVGSMSRVKGHDLLIKAWAKIHDRFPKFTLHIYGAPKDNFSMMENLIYDNKMQNTVFLHPPQHYIKEKYVESAVCILPSRVEGFGMVLIEAMECGTPCIATSCEGPMDIIKHEENGIIVPTNDSEAIAQAISSLLSDKSKLLRYSHNAKISASRYSIDVIMHNWIHLIN
ncbi:MAG: glycosyltransferase [Muribaculaceae bacterium]|nr:glycosyltransferase [Muribaculaceae bacterium]